MKTGTFLWLVVIALTAAPAAAQKVWVDHDDTVDYSQFETFAIVETGDNLKEINPLAHDRVMADIRTYFSAVGLKEVDRDAHVSISYHSAEKKEEYFTTAYTALHWGSSWMWGNPHMGRSSTNIVTSTIGTLIIDVIETEEKKLIWRGTAPGVLSGKPQKAAKRTSTAIKKLAAQWRSML